MFMIIIHIAYITRLVTNDAWHPYYVIGVYKVHHRAGGISYFLVQARLWFTGTVIRGRGPLHLTKLAILRLANTVMGEVGAHNQVVRGGMPSGQEAKTIGQKTYCID